MKDHLIAWKPSGPPTQPSARLRAYLPCEYLQSRKWNCEIYNEKNIDKYSLVIFQKCYSKEDIQLALFFKNKNIITVFDLCDNHFYIPEESEFFIERASRLKKMIDSVDYISVSTKEIALLIPERNCTIIDDATDEIKINILSKFRLSIRKILNKNFSGRIKLVWYGSAGMENPPFGLIDLVRIIPILEKINSTLPLELMIISNDDSIFKKHISKTSFKISFRIWKQKNFPYLLQQNDICLIPISLNPFTVCKTNNRPLLSLKFGVPVIADSIPSYEEFSDFILFSNWEGNIKKYATNKELRETHIKKAKSYIDEMYSKKKITNQWTAFIAKIMSEKR